jgi:hypothetical protein
MNRITMRGVHVIANPVWGARFRDKTGKGVISTEGRSSILELPIGSTFFDNAADGVNPIKTQPQQPRVFGIEFPTAARACVRGVRHARAPVENSRAAVLHLTKPHFLSK